MIIIGIKFGRTKKDDRPYVQLHCIEEYSENEKKYDAKGSKVEVLWLMDEEAERASYDWIGREITAYYNSWGKLVKVDLIPQAKTA